MDANNTRSTVRDTYAFHVELSLVRRFIVRSVRYNYCIVTQEVVELVLKWGVVVRNAFAYLTQKFNLVSRRACRSTTLSLAVQASLALVGSCLLYVFQWANAARSFRALHFQTLREVSGIYILRETVYGRETVRATCTVTYI